MSSKFVVAVVAALLVVLSGPPASAGINDVGSLTGVAEVGKTFWDGNDCDKTGNANVVGRGLYVVGTPEDQGREAQGSWHLDAVVISVNHPEGVRLEACGWLDAVAGTEEVQWPGQADPRTNGVGAACGASRGHSGMGEFGPEAAPFAKLMHLGWNGVGPQVPVTGQYQEYTAPNRAAKGKKGSVIAQLQLTGGGGNCVLDPDNGAENFNVVGMIVFVNQESSKPPAEECKETDPDMDKAKEQVPGSDADWKRACPSAKK